MQPPSSTALFRLEFDNRLMEEAVMLRMAGHAQEGEFRRLRDRIYDLPNEEEREKQFNQLHQQWFLRLDLGHSVGRALGEQPLLMRNTRGCRVVRVIFPKEEGADLYGSPPMTIGLTLRASSLLNDSALLAFLRHEFMHLADMLDPCFAYEPELPRSEAGPTHDNLLRERYRVLWNTWIDGRLLRQKWAGEQVRQKRLAEFRATFPMLGGGSETKFSEWFDSPFHTHKDLVAFALHPETAGPHYPSEQSGAGRCGLCQFPSFDLQDGRDLPAPTVEEVLVDFPNWRPNQGLCRQCADLYQSRHFSQSAEATLPKT
ncbi:MAG: hypothetical protein ACE5MK_08400 [Acidobacteriota bacterium]